jgi:lipopolysaccharide export LptBFGC system permease protein LptF
MASRPGGRMNLRMSPTLFRYVFKDLLKVFLIASGALAGIMSFGALLRPLTQNGLDGSQVLLLLRYFMPAMSAYSFPVAALFATTFVYGRMSADNEITACRASGIDFIIMTAPAVLLGLFVAFISMYMLCFNVPAATMKAEQVVTSNLAELIAHQISQTHQTGMGGDFTVYAQEATVPPEDAKNPEDQVVVLRAPLFTTYYTPPGQKPYYRVAKEFWSASSATAHIRENPADSSAQITVTLVDGVEFPREFSGAKSSQAGVGAAQFGPKLIPSPIGQKTKFMSISELKDLEKDPSQGKQVQAVLADFIKEDQAQAILRMMSDGLSGPSAQCQLQATGETYSIAGPAAALKITGDALTITASKPTVQVRQESNAQVRLSAQGSVCRVTVTADPDNDQAFIALEMKDAVVDSGDSPSVVPLSRKFVIPLPPAIADYKNRTFETYRSEHLRDIKATEKLLFAWTDLVNHIISEINARLAFVVSCVLLVLVGSSLGMMFRSGNFLTAFAVSVVPALLSTVLIVTGQHTVESTPVHLLSQSTPMTLGISLIWSGNVIIGIGAVVLLMRLQRR